MTGSHRHVGAQGRDGLKRGLHVGGAGVEGQRAGRRARRTAAVCQRVAVGTDSYTLTYRSGATSAATSTLAFNASAADVQAALQAIAALGTNVTVAAGHDGGFDIAFDKSLGNVTQLFARLTTPLVTVTKTSTSVQQLAINAVSGFLGNFTLKYRYQETKALPFG